ncbi:MAG: tRNA (N(6)-L-threonylcarbamoyladenosine(37)-C(2))-methylthiotransferase MtaB [Lachnospiraceae bacterium]|nr:tRNA (N(6)-L-threonylcarbamoyladenosine(37)-C(2))-methylthiotransferase MtaB [Lachnospiraceae bacterium]
MKRAALHSLGCKVNSYETEAMRQMLQRAGYEIVPFHEEADLYVINTCSVTNIADRKSRQMIHRARKQNPDAVVVAAGCYVQTSREQAERDGTADILIGNNRKQDLVAAVREYEKRQDRRSGKQGQEEAGRIDPEERCPEEIWQMEPGERCSEEETLREPAVYMDPGLNRPGQTYEGLNVSRPAEHTRAFLKVQDGCNQFCSYCVIPYARGRVRSRPAEDVVRETQELAGNGFQEIVLTGIHLSSYGVDLGCSLLDLIRRLHEIDGIRRIRLGSLEPGIITESFVEELAGMQKVCPHFHLSLQSGSDTVLKRMNRKYTAAEYFDKCEMIRKYYEHPALTTDIIVGFPGETAEEFAETCAFVRRVSFYEIHVFKYSKRDGTAAARMDGQITEAVKTERSRILLDLSAKLKEQFVSWYEGRQVEVLFEETVTINGKNFQEGFTPEYVKTGIYTDELLRNRIMMVEFFRFIV